MSDNETTLDKFGDAGLVLIEALGPAVALWLLEKLGELIAGKDRDEAIEAVARVVKPEMTEEERKAQLAALILAATSG